MSGKSRFLVRGRFIDPGLLADAERSREASLNRVLPSQERLAELEASGAIVAGGVVAGCREIVFFVDVASNDELSAMMSALPFWSLLTWEVVPLQTFAARASQSRRVYGTEKTGREIERA